MPTVSSRTPEGGPQRCPICGKFALLETLPDGERICPNCGHLWGWFERRFGEGLRLQSRFTDDIGADSLDVVELVMELEEEFGVTIPDEEAEQIKTVEDAIRLIEKYLRGDEEE